MKYIFFFFLLLNNTLLISKNNIKYSHLSSQWYPSEKKSLQNMISDITQKAVDLYDVTLESNMIKAIIAPHAAYQYSGPVASGVYKTLDSKNIQNIIILATHHDGSFNGIALPNFDTYQTPLGSITIDQKIIKKLSKKKLFFIDSTMFEKEHSLEIQLPLIQTFLPNSTIIPLMVGSLNCEQADIIAKALKPFIDKNTLILISSDFTHYGKNFNYAPFRKNIKQNIKKIDSQAITTIENGDCKEFSNFIDQTGATICGRNPLMVLLSLIKNNALGNVEPRLIAYDTSNSNDEKITNSVSYVGMLFTQEKLDSLPFEKRLTQQEKSGLLQEAKDILKNLFSSEDKELFHPIQSYGLSKKYGGFTTLKINNELRGCIGRITTNEPIYKTIATVTQEAALEDSRFAPVTEEEIKNIEIELSILSPATSIKSYKDIILGKHGIILKSQNRSALFLPEVAPEFEWTIEETLSQLSQKAGLNKDSWKNKDTEFQVFTTMKIK